MLSSFEDARGRITDKADDVFWTEITNEPGAVRGNHRHLHTHQFTLVRKGKLRIVKKREGGVRAEYFLGPYGYDYSPPGEWHAWEALEYTEVWVFTHGPRAGTEFENDTIRLPESQRLL